jgi:hypothetical protein
MHNKGHAVDCEDIRQAVLANRAIDDDGRSHAASCAACTALLADDGQTGRRLTAATDILAPLAFDSVLTAVEAERGPISWLRSQRTPTRMLVPLGVALLVGVGMLFFQARADLEVYPLGRALLSTTSLALALALAIRLSVWPSHVPLPSKRAVFALLASTVFVPLVLAAMPAAHWEHPVATQGVGADWGRRAAACFFFGAAFGLPVLLSILAVDRGLGRTNVTLLGAAGVGLAGNLALQLHCPLTHPFHLVPGHATIVIVAISLAAVVVWIRRGSS